MNEVCWGMVGCGAVTEKKSGPGLYKSANSRLKAVYDLDYEKACDYARRHGVPVVARTVENILNDPEITAVYLPTPPRFHKEYALRCLGAGKIPYIEKPMALRYEECLEVMEAAGKARLPVYVAFYRRGMEKYLKIKELIDSGALGSIRFVRLSHFMELEATDLDRENLPWRLTPSATFGGKFVDMATHVLDVVDFLFGKITHVQGVADNLGGFYPVEDTLSAVMRCESGVVVSGMWCYVADHNEEEMLIVGEKGHIRTTGLFYGPVRVTVQGREELLDFPEPEHVAQPYIQRIVNEMTGAVPSGADMQSAANNVKIVDDLLREYRQRYPEWR
ncbi:Gfo/Idh/MocA family oxidoreductase [Oscillospiraceae bacterium MB08-C2-2]|nr:Gfo/Idh/MocA family oxidoreductase [Oscillospiraceae bacterium MB08-C2-2]